MLGADGEGAQGDGGADRSAHSLVPLRGHVALRFTFSIKRGRLDGMLPLVDLRLGARSRFDWLGLEAACRLPGASASI